MPRAICRCGQTLIIPADAPERVVCPKCSARIRIRRSEPAARPADAYIRFVCPCGRRLKIKAEGAQQVGQCPDCGRVVPVPTAAAPPSTIPSQPASQPEVPTEELSAVDRDMLEQWAKGHLARATDTTPVPVIEGGNPSVSAVVKSEAGLRVCPRCGRPVHLGAASCRHCGTPVPRR